MSRLFHIYSYLTGVMLLPISLVVIALLIIFKDDISSHWYTIAMALLYIDLGYAISLLLFRVIRQGEKDSFPGSKDDLESEIQKATKEEIVKSKTATQQSDSASQSISEQLNVDKKPSVSILDLHTAFIGSEDRLKNELKANSKRASNNLVIGSAMGLMGIMILIWFVSDLLNGNIGAEEPQILHSIETFCARLCIVFLIELFSFFFLKLYKDCIERTRYYQNELTNIESKKIAILASAILGDTEHTKAIIEGMLCVERNFVIPKDCTTIELEKIRSNSKTELGVIDVLGKLGLKLSAKCD